MNCPHAKVTKSGDTNLVQCAALIKAVGFTVTFAYKDEKQSPCLVCAAKGKPDMANPFLSERFLAAMENRILADGDARVVFFRHVTLSDVMKKVLEHLGGDKEKVKAFLKNAVAHAQPEARESAINKAIALAESIGL